MEQFVSFFHNNILFFSIVIASVVGKLKETSKRNILTAWVIYFFGTLFHELSHFLVSLITFGRPVWISVFPKSEVDADSGKKYITLGYVKSSNVRWYNTFFISMAPLLLFPLSFYCYKYFFFYFEDTIVNTILYIFCIVSLVFSAIPSGADFKNWANGSVVQNLTIPAIILFLCYLYFFDKIAYILEMEY